MTKYVCSVCGFVYDEANGLPESGIAPGTIWDDLQVDLVCPLCGAEKSEFEKQGESASTREVKRKPVIDTPSDIKQLSPLEISALCTNLARGCEKQYKPEEAALFNELADYFKSVSAPSEDPNFNRCLTLLKKTYRKVSQMQMPQRLMRRIEAHFVPLPGVKRLLVF